MGKRNSGVVCRLLCVRLTYISARRVIIGVVVPIKKLTLFLDPINTIPIMTYVQHKIIHKRF